MGPRPLAAGVEARRAGSRRPPGRPPPENCKGGQTPPSGTPPLVRDIGGACPGVPTKSRSRGPRGVAVPGSPRNRGGGVRTPWGGVVGCGLRGVGWWGADFVGWVGASLRVWGRVWRCRVDGLIRSRGGASYPPRLVFPRE